ELLPELPEIIAPEDLDPSQQIAIDIGTVEARIGGTRDAIARLLDGAPCIIVELAVGIGKRRHAALEHLLETHLAAANLATLRFGIELGEPRMRARVAADRNSGGAHLPQLGAGHQSSFRESAGGHPVVARAS